MERCEVDGDIIRYCEQPITINYIDLDGATRKHTPDLYYETDAIRSFVEVKWESDARKPRNEARWPAIAAAINGMGFRYEVLTERHILRQPAADNIAELLRFRRTEPLPSAVRDAVVGVLGNRPVSIADITALVPGTDNVVAFAQRYVFTPKLAAELGLSVRNISRGLLRLGVEPVWAGRRPVHALWNRDAFDTGDLLQRWVTATGELSEQSSLF